jgi:hypothetical protein
MAANLLDIDTRLAKAVEFKIGRDNVRTIEFQFPPKITTDSRAGTWTETEVPGDQPFQAWKTSGARKITLEWTYIIGANGWDVQKVRNQILTLRGYYTAPLETIVSAYIVMFKIWKLGGTDPMSCRLGNIDISHGKALYIPTVNGSPNIHQAHPVITNIKVGMQLWSRGNVPQDTTNQSPQAQPPKVAIAGLISAVPPDWQ